MDSKAKEIKRIGITGCAGAIGKCVSVALHKRGHFIRGCDISADGPEIDEYIQADICDLEAMKSFAEGMDIIIHLAAFPNNGNFMEEILEPNFIGGYMIMEAAREANIDLFIGTSSIQVNSGSGFDEKISIDEEAQPVNIYAVSKIYAEALGRMYSNAHDMSVLIVRPGWFLRDKKTRDQFNKSEMSSKFYLSHDDCCRFYIAAVETNSLAKGAYAVLWMMSKGSCVDMDVAKDLIAYEAQDAVGEGSYYDD
ncbi:MAG: NAD(P)-dependent oxidoreductase [Lentisphaeria bacterium]|nr:NAD(P)-dependent oxidoreductase [Lentisphaeria bacterium]NQZ70162.1 NAD(P)-dependent oxidoreductase [Lentisphaeria bacterium]